MADASPQGKELSMLVKLLKMTTSPQDHEALVAMRKANEQLLKLGGDWEKLLFGKVTIIADPFTNLSSPPKAKPPKGEAPPPPRPSRPFADPPPFTPRSAPPRTPTWVHRVPPTLTATQMRTRIMINNAQPEVCQQCCKHISIGAGMGVRYTGGADWYFFCDQDCESDWFKAYAPKPKPTPTPPPAPQRSARENAYSGNCLHCGNFVPAKSGFIIPRDPRGWDLVCSMSCNTSAAKAKPAGSIDDL
jgi:hypothetical protein